MQHSAHARARSATNLWQVWHARCAERLEDVHQAVDDRRVLAGERRVAQHAHERVDGDGRIVVLAARDQPGGRQQVAAKVVAAGAACTGGARRDDETASGAATRERSGHEQERLQQRGVGCNGRTRARAAAHAHVRKEAPLASARRAPAPPPAPGSAPSGVPAMMLAAMLAAVVVLVRSGRTPSSSSLPSPLSDAVLTLWVYGSSAPMMPAGVARGRGCRQRACLYESTLSAHRALRSLQAVGARGERANDAYCSSDASTQSCKACAASVDAWTHTADGIR